MLGPLWLQPLSRADFLQSVGLHIARDRLFLVRVRKRLFRLTIVEEQARELAVGGEKGSERQDLTEAIRSLLPHFNPTRDPLYLSLSLDQGIVAPVLLPAAAEGNFAQVLEYEIERLLPLRREEMYYDFLPVGRRGDKTGLVLFAVPRKILDDILGQLAVFGIRPRAVETSATALANYLLFCTGAPALPAVIFGGEHPFWEVMALKAGTNGWKRQPEILFAHSLPEADWIQASLRELVCGLSNNSVHFFRWSTMTDFLSSVHNSVGAEDLVALGKKRLFGDQKIDLPLVIPAIGAALSGVREATLAVNLLPEAARKARGKAQSWLNAALLVVFFLGLLAWAGSYPLKDEIRLRQVQAENEKIGPRVEALRKKEEELKALTREISFLSASRERKGEILQILDELSRIVPNSAYLSNLRYRDGTVEVQGSAENASNLVPLLERSPLFKNVGFNAPSNRGRDNRETFSLKAEMERAEAKENKP